MRRELIALGGAASPPNLNDEKKPSIGASSILQIEGEAGLLIDAGSYYQYGKAREEETASIILESKSIGPYEVPMLSESYLQNDNDMLPSNTDTMLPDFRPLEDLKELYIIITHAHGDHVGSLPVLRKMLAGKKIKLRIFATDVTCEIADWSWKDQHRLMTRRGQKPGYTIHMLKRLLKEIERIVPGQRMRMGPFDVSFIHAGHILGAVSVLSKVGINDRVSTFFTSDISFREQFTIHGAPLLSDDDLGKIDYLVTEFTYGCKKEPDRKLILNKMIADILETVKKGGKVLIPVLSIGRAMEVYSALKTYGVNNWPIWITGSARTNANIYEKYGAVESDIYQHFVRGKEDCYRIAKHPEPCIMLAPAGMMGGGWSVFFAEKWMSDPKNLIAFTSFQGKNTPGYKLLRMKPGQILRFGKKSHVRLLAKVKRYPLSAHASGDEIEAMIQRLNPRHILLVHGDEEVMDKYVATSGDKAKKTIVGKRYPLK